MSFEPVLLARINKPDSPKLEGYRADGGYATFERALKEKKPEEVTAQVKDSGLRGRGGAGFPTGLKWTFLPKDHPGPIYLCVNADESEPCTYNNRILMEKDPHQVLEGIMLACYAIKSRCAYFYIRYEYGTAYRTLQAAVDECYAAGLLGKNIHGSGFDLDIFLHRGAGAYICGEETGLIESLEGKRAWPRIKPPFPAIEGAFRKPTIVNNVETLACVTQVMKRGNDWFKSLGVPPDPKNPRDAGSYGPKLYTIAGHVNTPKCVELPMGITIRDLVDKHGGGVWKGRKAKAVNPGGLSMGFVDVNAKLKDSDLTEYDIPLDFNGPGKVQCLGLGTAAVTVIDDETSMVDVLHNVCQFFSHESCGQCTPCREGTGWMLKIVDRLRRGQGRKEDLDILVEVSDRIGIMPGTTICGLSDGAGWPVKTAIRKFRAEFEAAIKGGGKSKYAKALPLVGAGH
ncbi:NADH-quinone oxidoreductase subunit NuoF [Fimbriiglobus ruber]|uniref:NADH-ubiquinone oxidoreductase chain F n=1 Tax=Fimbriiglobus ruber TaxID=1908690 RepID=A0A225DL21_9BACT|nr:NADH-quinone oxidoreductase subunit NuoF [Fimbriiglobus ruber]OWK41663.1 NADH-ubiquinone oxidoreductase chain F [Fimbriiglobus ruber]